MTIELDCLIKKNINPATLGDLTNHLKGFFILFYLIYALRIYMEHANFSRKDTKLYLKYLHEFLKWVPLCWIKRKGLIYAFFKFKCNYEITRKWDKIKI